MYNNNKVGKKKTFLLSKLGPFRVSNMKAPSDSYTNASISFTTSHTPRKIKSCIGIAKSNCKISLPKCETIVRINSL